MRKTIALGGASAIALTLLSAPQVAAQTAAEAAAVGEVVVTARRRDERLRDVPTAATAFGAEQIEQMGGIATTQSLLTNVPGVNFADTVTPVTSEVSIRGSGTSRGTSAEAAVGLFRNGVFIGGGQVGGRTFSKLDFFDVSRIEVLRGVQGALNGRNAVGGSINILSARPTQQAGGFALGEIGVNERREVQLVVNQPLNEYFAVRVGVDLMKQPKGFYYNPIRDEYFDRQETEIFRVQLGYENGPLTANMLYEHGRDQLPGLMYQLHIAPNATYPRGLFQDKYNIPWNHTSSAKQQVNYYEFTTAYDLGVGTLSSTSAVRERRSQNAYDRDASSPQFQAEVRAAGLVAPGAVLGDANLGGSGNDFARILYQGINYVAEKAGQFSWLVGGEFFDLNDKYKNTLSKSSTPADRSYGTVGVSRSEFRSWAVYGSAGFDVTERLNLTGELRYTKDKKSLLSNRFDFGTGLPTGVGFKIDSDTESDNISYNVTAGYKIGDWLTYAKMGTAYRAGGFNLALGDPRQPVQIPVTFDDEEATSYEIGAKGNIHPRVYVAAAAYRTNIDALLIQTDNGCRVGLPACPVQATSFAFNSGKAELWGVEVEVTGQAQIAGGTARLTVGGSRQGGDIVSGPDKGKRGPQRPDWTGNFNFNYRRPITTDYVGFFNLKGNGRWGGVQEIAQIPQLHDFQIYDVRAGIQRDAWEVAVFSNNVGQESYIVFEAISTRRNNAIRTYGAQLRYRW